MAKPKHQSFSGVILLAIAVALMVGAPEAPGSELKPLGDRYVSISVVRDGDPHELVKGTRIRLRFEQRKRRDVLRWHAGCNRFGARVKIRPRRLRTGRVGGTEKGCRRALLRQDQWLASFLEKNPRWTLRGKRLTLRSGDDVIRLRRR